jgi:cardiolipin synthase A/B
VTAQLLPGLTRDGVRAAGSALAVQWRRLDRRLVRPYPPLTGNRVELLEFGKSFFGRMLDAVAAARSSVDVEMYLWDVDEVGRGFVRALSDAARRGVRVRVLADAYGARAVVRLLREVAEAGGDVRVFNPFRVKFLRRYFHRTHKKLLLVDGELAFTGGAGFSLCFSSGRRREAPWFDRMFELSGPVCAQLAQVFDTDFHRWHPEPRFSRSRTLPPAAPELPPPAGTSRVRVLRGWPDARDFPVALLEAVHAARERIWIGTPYFVPPRMLARALYRARLRGVDVQVVVPSREYAHPLLYHACRRRYRRWLRQGFALFEFEPSFYHAKMVVADRSVALVGSSNLDAWSWRRNAEIDLTLEDPATVDALAAAFERDRGQSRLVSRADLTVRGWADGAYERLARALDGWL